MAEAASGAGPHVCTLLAWASNPGLLARPLEFRGTPACFARNRRLWNIAEAGGTIWVVISEPRSKGQPRLYRLAYKMVGCHAVERDTRWGQFGVAGDPDASISYGSNDVETVLMALRFRNAVPIQSRRKIGYRLAMKQELGAEGIERISAFADALPRKWSIFLSYSHEADAGEAIWLEQELQRNGKSVFRDGGALRAGQVWDEKIFEAIDGARYFVVLCSDASAESGFVQDEVQRAVKRSQHELSVIPVAMPGAALEKWGQLGQYQRVEWDPEDRDANLQALLRGMSEP